MNPRLLRPTPSGFDPRAIGTLRAWYDFSDSSSLTVVSGFVSEIRNKSGSLPTLSQSVEADRPSLGSIGGRQAGLFDGSNDVLFSGTNGVAVGTLFAVIGDEPTGALAAVSFCAGGPAAEVLAMAIGSRSTAGDGITADVRYGLSNAQVGSTVQAATYLAALRFDLSVPPVFRVNGTPVTGAGAIVRGNQSHCALGAKNTNFVYGNFWGSTIGEVLFYADNLSDPQTLAVEAYLKAKWSVSY